MKRLLTPFVLLVLAACNLQPEEKKDINPASEGFNAAASDSAAIAIADSVMVAMGGRQAWEDLRYIQWDFFGVRDLVWDKKTGRVRIDFPRDSSIFLINVKTNSGKVFRKGVEITQADSLAKYISKGKSIWINDSYWLVMPFKLKDTGVTLTYQREDTTMKGVPAHVLKLMFNSVGDTPDNMYEVFVDKQDYLVRQWNYYRTYQQDSASAVWPMDNYKAYNGVLISADRSDNRGPRNVHVYDSLPSSVFELADKPRL